LPGLFVPKWTIDRDRKIYLMGVGSSSQVHEEDPLTRFLLDWNGSQYFIDLVPGRGSMRFSEQPYVVSWNAIRALRPTDLHGRGQAEVVSMLKEALTVLGAAGADGQVPNAVVEFNF
jgi:hypothetical protein